MSAWYEISKDYYQQNLRTVQYLCADIILSPFLECYAKVKVEIDIEPRDLDKAQILVNESFSKSLRVLVFEVKTIYSEVKAAKQPGRSIKIDLPGLIYETINLRRTLRTCVQPAYQEFEESPRVKVIQFLQLCFLLAKEQFMDYIVLFDEYVPIAIQCKNRVHRREIAEACIMKALEFVNESTFGTLYVEPNPSLADWIKHESESFQSRATESDDADQKRLAQQQILDEQERLRAKEQERVWKWCENISQMIEQVSIATQTMVAHSQEATDRLVHLGQMVERSEHHRKKDDELQTDQTSKLYRSFKDIQNGLSSLHASVRCISTNLAHQVTEVQAPPKPPMTSMQHQAIEHREDSQRNSTGSSHEKNDLRSNVALDTILSAPYSQHPYPGINNLRGTSPRPEESRDSTPSGQKESDELLL